MSLGVLQRKTGESQPALQHFQQAIQLVPHSSEANANAAFALSVSGCHSEAEMAARTAIRYDSGNIQAHYILGVSLLGQGRSSEEGIVSLPRAARRFLRARLAGAQMLVDLGRNGEALTELRSYLSAGGSDSRGHVLAWINLLAGAEPYPAVFASKSG